MDSFENKTVNSKRATKERGEDQQRRLNIEQKEILVAFMERHPDLKSGKFTSTFTKRMGTKLWMEVAGLLNAVPCAAMKSHDQWRKCWTDLKRHTKQKASRIKKHERGTGGGKKIDESLNNTQSRICDLLGETAIEGHKNIPESSAVFDFGENSVLDLDIYDSDNCRDDDDMEIEVTQDGSGIDNAVSTVSTLSTTTESHEMSSARLTSTETSASAAASNASIALLASGSGSNTSVTFSTTAAVSNGSIARRLPNASTSAPGLNGSITRTLPTKPTSAPGSNAFIAPPATASGSNTPTTLPATVFASNGSITRKLPTASTAASGSNLRVPTNTLPTHTPTLMDYLDEENEMEMDAAHLRGEQGTQASKRKDPKEKQPKLFATRRLDNTVEASKKLAEIGNERNKIKSTHYERKVCLMERDTIANEEKARALTNISNNLQIMADAILLNSGRS